MTHQTEPVLVLQSWLQVSLQFKTTVEQVQTAVQFAKWDNAVFCTVVRYCNLLHALTMQSIKFSFMPPVHHQCL